MIMERRAVSLQRLYFLHL